MTSQVKTFLLLGVLSALVIFLGGLLGGRIGIFIAFALAIIMNVGNYWYSDKIVLAIYHARETEYDDAPYIHDIVEDLARRAGLPKPKIYIIPEEAPNAFATGRDPEHAALAVTEGLLSAITPEQLRGALAHEMAHVKNRDILIQTTAAILGSAIVTLANIFQFTAIFGGNDRNNTNPFVAIILALLAPIAAALIQMAISRSREFLADETGARLCQDPLALAGALQTLAAKSGQIPLTAGNPSTSQLFIVQPQFALDAKVQNLFSTHPPLSERIERLQGMVNR